MATKTTRSSLGLGFRPPQFSEETAWLPAWLQSHDIKSSIDHESEARITSPKDYQNFESPQGRVSERKEVDRLCGDGGRNNFHLFLSGENNSSINFTPSLENGLHFQLHLSSNGDTKNSESQLLSIPQSNKEYDKILSMQEVKTATDYGEKDYQSKQHCHPGRDKSYDKESSDNASPQSPIDNKERKSEETFIVQHIKDSKVNDAVELSVAASEALVIHELVSASGKLPATAVLEAALRVKQARLEDMEDSFCYPMEETEEIDFLSDLDDWTMAASFEDVGISFSGFGSIELDSSQVQETPVSDEIHGCENGLKSVEFPSQQKKISDDLGLATANYIYLKLNEPKQEVSDASTVRQKVDIVSEFDGNTSQAQTSKNAERQGKASSSVANKFGTHYITGCIGKEVDGSAPHNDTKRVPSHFVGETSFLSESADIAPDENSFVQKPEAGYQIASQSSVPSEGLRGKDNEVILVSQDIVRSSDLSLVDPLCSVVPCSVSLENYNHPQNQNHTECAVGNRLDPLLELETTCTLGTSGSGLNIESACTEGQTEMKTDGECSLAPTRRQLTSLKEYSTRAVKCNTILDGEHSVPNISLRLEQTMCCISSYNKKDSKTVSSYICLDEATNGKESEQYQSLNLVEEAAGGSIHTCKPVENEPALQASTSKKCKSPLLLTQRMRQRLRASNLRVRKLGGKKNRDYTRSKEITSELPKSKNLQKRQPECDKLNVDQVQARKRVRFSEVETELGPGWFGEQLPSSHINCATVAAGKRLRYSNAPSDISSQIVEKCVNDCLKDAKKLIFLGFEFLLTGIPDEKEKDIELQIRKHGGIILVDIPPAPNSRGKKSSGSHLQQTPIILCPKKLQTSKFLYGCAVNAFILRVQWITDSIAAGSIMPPAKYMLFPRQSDTSVTEFGKSVHNDNDKYIFQKVGIMFNGKPSFCTKFATIVKHGGGQVFKSLHWLAQSVETKRITLGAIVAENDIRVSRHLRHCALERKIPIMPACWIIKSLHLRMLQPHKKNNHTPLPTIKVPQPPCSLEWSQEI